MDRFRKKRKTDYMKKLKREQRGKVKKCLPAGEKKIDAVITVEASFVMAVVLFICGALISQGFYVHERNTGMLILMDALEQTQMGRENPDAAEENGQWANRALNSYYRCSGCHIEIVRRGNSLTGNFKCRNGKTGGSVQMKLFEPERFLRIVRAGEI